MSLNTRLLPSWLVKNALFRRLFLYRKIFLTRAKRHHFSEFAEDIAVRRLFPDDFRGFFVDVGCFHPIQCSNTWDLYRRGWRGINIDIDALKIEAFDLVRPDDLNIQCAVTGVCGETDYYTNGLYSRKVSLNRPSESETNLYRADRTRCAQLSTLIDETSYCDRPIDFLNIDAEGHDLEVLRSLDFERYSPKLIAVESHQSLWTEVSRSPLYRSLQRMGYALVGWCGLTLLLASPSKQRQLASPQ